MYDIDLVEITIARLRKQEKNYQDLVWTGANWNTQRSILLLLVKICRDYFSVSAMIMLPDMIF